LHVVETENAAAFRIGTNLAAASDVSGALSSAFVCENGSIGFPNSIISSDFASKLGVSDIQILGNNGATTFIGLPQQHQSSAAWMPAPRIEVHQNPAFDDDEGIAESGL
uniref:Gamma-glutamyltransferase n=1 Tax=Gongylonema pulchrum TaxID=637853 RepID=A0A183ES24_9BILA